MKGSGLSAPLTLWLYHRPPQAAASNERALHQKGGCYFELTRVPGHNSQRCSFDREPLGLDLRVFSLVLNLTSP